MSDIDQLLETYDKSFVEKLNRKKYDKALLKAIVEYLGTSVYGADSSKVACSQKTEIDDIKTHFLIGELGLADSEGLDTAIKDVCQQMGSSNRNKYRPIFYYLLVEKFEKQYHFLTTTTKKTSKVKTEKTAFTDNDKTEKASVSTESSEQIVFRYAQYSAMAGLVPIPLVDLASITTIQYKMIRKLSENYEHVTFDDTKAKSALTALMGGLSSINMGLFTRLLFKGIPIFGTIIGASAVSAYAYLSTKVIGEIMDEHFASGGTLAISDIGLQKMKAAFDEGIDAARTVFNPK